MNRAALWLAVGLGLLVGSGRLRADEMPPPLSPEEGLRSLRVRPGLRAELVASEPLVVDPVAIDWGTDGRLWVCEMRDYPSGMDGNWKPGGQINVLEDTDGDGTYDKSTVFLDGLPFPTGVMAWRKGALVCAAPEIIYAEDTDGDGKADKKEVVFRGFATENYQARVNGLSYNLDNWVYGANGLIGGTIRGMASGKEVNIGGRDFRIKPDDGILEPASGLTQQGRVHDDEGNQFGGSNSVLLQHYPFPDHAARRNPHVAPPAPAVYVPNDPDSHRVFPASRTIERFNHPESANRVTSACGIGIYRDDLLGKQYTGNAFICEPVHNLVHREVLSPDGVTVAGHRASDEQESEFLASTDNWFRPAQVRTGPDGALYVVDMYRYVIEHPRWISPEILAHLDVRAGADKGRIYRIVPEHGSLRPVPNLDRMTTAKLAEAIDSPNGTERENVHRLLVHRQDQGAAPVLAGLVKTSKRPMVRMQALCALDGLNALTTDLLRTALSDQDARVRRQGVRLAGARLDKNPDLGEAVLALVDDPEVRVRFELAQSLGQWNDPKAGKALGRLAVADGAETWMRAAVLSASASRTGDVLAAVLEAKLEPSVRSLLLEPLIATAAGVGDAQALAVAFEALATPESGKFPPWRLAALGELLDAVNRPGRSGIPPKVNLGPAFEAARALATSTDAAPADRMAAVRMLGAEEAGRAADLAQLGALLSPTSPAVVQTAAVRSLARTGDDRVPGQLLEGWKGMVPSLRGLVLDALLARTGWTKALLDALEQKEIAPAEIDAAHRQRLLTLNDAALKTRAAKVLESAQSQPRQEVIDATRAALKGRKGDPARGAAVFGKVCAGCHVLGGQGHEVGPDLAALTDTSDDALLTAILDPNREVDARYAEYAAALKDGRVLTGLIAAETAGAITLKRQDGQADSILRTDLETLAGTGRSLMPEGLEKDLSADDLGDLLTYLDAGGAPPKTLAGNHPETVIQKDGGPIRLTASTASVYGPTLTFEPEFGNLGYWTSAADRASWTFQVNQPGTFTVSMESACAEDSAGNLFVVKVGDRTLRGGVGSTGVGTWANYRSTFVGELTLSAGLHRLDFRPAQPPKGALVDLRAVVLTPRAGRAGPQAKP